VREKKERLERVRKKRDRKRTRERERERVQQLKYSAQNAEFVTVSVCSDQTN
jgi:hypothetical protein